MNKNKIIFSILTLTFFVGALQAQTTYVKFDKDTQPEGKNIKFFQNEIYQVVDTLPTDTINKIKQYRIVAMEDTIIVGRSVSLITIYDKNYGNSKNDFVKLDRENNKIYCDVKLLKKEKIFYGTYIIGKFNSIIKNLDGKIAKSELGNSFRLIIPYQPAIWYKTSELTEYENAPFYLTWWFIAIVLLAVIAGAAGGYFIPKIFCKGEKLQEVEYDGSNITEWAEKHNTSIHLLKLHNPEHNNIWEQINEQETDWTKIQNALNGQKLKIIEQRKELTVKKTETQTTTFQGNLLTTADFKKIIGPTQNDIFEIKKLLLANDDKDKITELEKTIGTKETKIKGLETELLGKVEELKNVITEKNKLKNKIEENKKTILTVDFLKDYAGKVYDYLNYCQSKVYQSAIKLYNDLQQPEKAGMLLLNFETAIKDLQTGEWLQILSAIKERGVIVTSSQDIIKPFAQPESDEEKLREFKHFLFNELLVKYSSSLLILAEAFRNLNHFGVAIKDSQKYEFADFVQNIQTKAGNVDMKIKYVPLFENGNSSKYLFISKSTGNNVSPAYFEVIKNLKKDDIAEIVSYGTVTEFDDTQTQIKIA